MHKIVDNFYKVINIYMKYSYIRYLKGKNQKLINNLSTKCLLNILINNFYTIIITYTKK